MKKIIAIISMMSLTIGALNSQTFIPRVGVTLSKVAVESSIGMKQKVGFTVGFGYAIDINDEFAIQPELNFIQKGYRSEFDESFDFDGLETSMEFEDKLTINYIEVPVLAKYTVGTKVKIHFLAGPSLGFGLSGKYNAKTKMTTNFQGDVVSETENETYDIKFGDSDSEEEFYINNRLDLGIQIGVGATIAEKIQVEFRYGNGFSNLMDESEDIEDNKTQNRVLQFTVGMPIRF